MKCLAILISSLLLCKCNGAQMKDSKQELGASSQMSTGQASVPPQFQVDSALRKLQSNDADREEAREEIRHLGARLLSSGASCR
jgi:hypothetical protein